MYRRFAVILSVASLASLTFAQDSGGWKKFGTTSSGDQAYSLNQSAPAQNGQAAPAAPAPSQITLPAGTLLRVRVDEKLSSDKNQPGDFFTATLVQPLVANGLVIAQPGQDIAGRVSEAVRAKDGNGRSRLGLELTELSLVDGQQVPVRTQLMEYRRPTDNGRDTGIVFGTTAAGAAIGAVAGGGLGAGIGAVSGGMAGLIGVLATRSHATEIHPEAVLTFRTIDAVTIATDRSSDAFQPVRQQPEYRSDVQPRQRAEAPPAPNYGYYGGYYGGYYPPYYYPYYAPYPYYGLGFGGFYYGGAVVIHGGGGHGGGFHGGGGHGGGHGGHH